MEKQTQRPWRAIFCMGLLVLIAFWLLGRWLSYSAMTASAGAPPPDRPLFEGEPFTARVDRPGLHERASIVPTNIGGGWNTVYTETFESGISPVYWDVFDGDGTENGEYKWGIETYTNTTPGGTYSAWAVGDGFNGGQLVV